MRQEVERVQLKLNYEVFYGQNVTSRWIKTPHTWTKLACIVDPKAASVKPTTSDWVAQYMLGSPVNNWKMRARSHWRWGGQLIFTEGQCLELSLVPSDKDERLQWSNFKGCRFSLFIHSHDSCQSDKTMNPRTKLAGRPLVIGLYGSSCHKRASLQANTVSINSKLRVPVLLILFRLKACFLYACENPKCLTQMLKTDRSIMTGFTGLCSNLTTRKTCP